MNGVMAWAITFPWWSGHKFHGHNGSITGFIATTAYSPELGVGYFVSINVLSGRLNGISERIVKFLTADQVVGEGPSVSLDAAQLERVAGYYQVATPRTQLTNFILRFVWLWRVWAEDGRLYQQSLLGGEKTEWIPVSETSFRQEEEPIATVFLVSDDQGATYLQSAFEGHVRKISAPWAWFQPIAAGLALLLMVSSLLFGLVWLVARLFRRMKSVPGSLVLPQFLATLSLFGGLTLTVVTLSTFHDLLRVSVTTLSLFLGTTLFALLSLYLAFRLIRPMPVEAGPVLRNWFRLVSVACIGMTIFLVSEDLVGLRLWSY